MAKYGEDDINALHPSLRSIYTKPEKSLGLDKDKITIDLLRDVFRKNCINLIPEFAQSGKAKLTAKQLILAYHLSRGTVKGTANQIRDLMELSPYFDFQPEYMLPILRPVKSNVEYCKKSRGFRMLAVVYAGEEAFNMSKLLDWSFSFTFHVEYVLRRHKITKTYEEFAKFNFDSESELLSLPAFPERKNLDKNSLGLELQEYICRLHHSLAERGVFSPRLMQFLGVDFERVQSEEEGAFVLALDTPGLIPNTAWHFIDEKWLDSWRVYVRGRPPRRYYPPGPITNDHIFISWKAYDEALQAAQRAEAEELHLQRTEPVDKSTFATRVIKLAKESAKLASLHATAKKGMHHHKHLNEILFSDDKPNNPLITNTEGDKPDDSEDETDENEVDEENNSGNSDDSGNLTDIDDDDDEEDEEEVEQEKVREIRDNPDATVMQDEDKWINTNAVTLKRQLSRKQTVLFSSHTDSQARNNKQRKLRALKRLKKRKVTVKQKTYVQLPAKLEVIKDYRVVNYNVWRFLQLVHGGGPVISRELSDLYSPRQHSFLQAVIFIQTRIRVKLARLALQRLQMRKLSQTYAGKMLLVSEAKQCIADRATRQLETLRQSRITKNLDIAATFTQNLWRLKKNYYNEEALEAKQREQAAFAQVHALQNDVPLSSNTTRDGQQVVLDRKPIVQIGNAHVYTVVFSDSDSALPFMLARAIGTEQAVVITSNDERRVALQSILLSINGIPTNTLSFEDVKRVLSHASTPLNLEFMRPFEARLLPTLLNLVDMKLQGAGKFAMYAAFKLALFRGIRLIKHHVNGKGIFCTSHRTILKINDKELLYQSHVVKPQFYHTISPAILFANKLTKSNNNNLYSEQTPSEQPSIVLPYDPEKEWVRFSLFDIKFIREGRDSEIIQSRKLSPFHALTGQGLHPSRCFEIVLEDRVLAFEFPSLRDEENYLLAELKSLEDAMQRVEAKRELLEGKATQNPSNRSNSLRPGNLTRSVTLQLKNLTTQVHSLQNHEIVSHSEEEHHTDDSEVDGDDDEMEEKEEEDDDEESDVAEDNESQSEEENEVARVKQYSKKSKNHNNFSQQPQRQQPEMKEDILADLYVCKRQLLTEKHMVERELLELETLRTYLTALRVRPLVDTVDHTVKQEKQEANEQDNEETDETKIQKMGAEPQDLLLLSSEEDDGLCHHLRDTFVDVVPLNANVTASAAQGKKHKHKLFTHKPPADSKTNNSNYHSSASDKKSASTNVDVDNDNQDFDEQDLAFCLKFQRDPSNDAFLYKRIVMTNLKRLVEEIRGSQVFVNKLGLPVRRRQQKTALKRVGGQDT